MKLHEITTAFRTGKQVRLDLLVPYAKLLYVIYKRQFKHEPLLMINTVEHSATYCRIVNFHRYLELLYEMPPEKSTAIHHSSLYLKRLL
jgi:hypothetical protein